MTENTINGIKWYKYDIREMTDAEFHNWYAIMSAEKQKRVDRFHFKDDKKRAVAGEMLARLALADWCQVEPRSISFGRGEHGKPFAEGLDAQFNISHSDDFVVCAVSDRPVGIDIEKIRPVDLKISKKICTPDELYSLFGHIPDEGEFVRTDNENLLNRFFRMWTKKEARGKFLGKGLLFGETDVVCNEFFVDDADGYIIALCTAE